LVDDDETVRQVGGRMLDRLGFEVIPVADGQEAVECFRRQADQIRCVLLDLTMPHLDGEECFRELRRIRKDVRVIVTSGYNEQEITQRFAGKGLAGFVQKPFTLSTLQEILKAVLG
jgi:two-component system cell cycle sensor histidine kinase/response regulator CckA